MTQKDLIKLLNQQQVGIRGEKSDISVQKLNAWIRNREYFSRAMARRVEYALDLPKYMLVNMIKTPDNANDLKIIDNYIEKEEKEGKNMKKQLKN